MKKYLIASAVIIGFASSAFAAAEISPQASTKHFPVKDTVGVCSVIDVNKRPRGVAVAEVRFMPN
jgi:hypothetical protein